MIYYPIKTSTELQRLLYYWRAVKAEHERVKAEEAKAESEQPKAEEVKAEEVEQPKTEEQQQTEEQVPTEEVPKQTEQGETSVQQGTPIDTDNQGSGQGEVKHEEAEPFNNLAAEVKKATGEKKNSILGQMRDIIANFAKKNGYAEPVFHLTREDFLNAEKPERRAEIEENLNNGFHMPAYYKDGKLHVYVEGCENFGKDVVEALAHESTHADNADSPENVSTITFAIENEHSVSIDEMLDILYNMSHSDHYEDEYDRLLAKGKNPNEMLADEVIAHAVARMVTNGEAALDEITNNELKFPTSENPLYKGVF